MVVHTMKKIVDAIKLNREIVEKWMLWHAVEEILDLYVSMSKFTAAIYLIHGEDD